MGNKTRIEWTDTTWNPVTGCSKVSQGCKNCYAERIFQRPYPGRDFTDVRMHLERLEQPLSWKRPRRIFVNSMSDLFHEKVSEDFLDSVFATMSIASWHTFQVLTKRPQRMRDYFRLGTTRRISYQVQELLRRPDNPTKWRWPFANARIRVEVPMTNVWLGVSVEDQETADERIPVLLQTPAAVRFVSYEPALGPVDFAAYTGIPRVPWEEKKTAMGFASSKLDWVIAGGESGPHARPSHPDWFRNLRDQCEAAGVPFFFKQWGEFSPIAPIFGDVDDFEERCKRCIARVNEDRTVGISLDGSVHPDDWEFFKDGSEPWSMARVGKQRAGRLLDGREWNEFPKVS